MSGRLNELFKSLRAQRFPIVLKLLQIIRIVIFNSLKVEAYLVQNIFILRSRTLLSLIFRYSNGFCDYCRLSLLK